MYKCKICKKTVGPKIPQLKVVVEKRPLPVGWEVIREIKVCPTCYGSKVWR